MLERLSNGYGSLQGFTGSYRLLEVARSYRGLKRVTGGYKGLQRITWRYRGFGGITGNYKGFERAARVLIG